MAAVRLVYLTMNCVIRLLVVCLKFGTFLVIRASRRLGEA